MTVSRWRLLLAFLVFAGWMAWLGYQALTFGRFPVLSRAQLLASTIDVIGVVTAGPDGRPLKSVQLQEVIWPKDGGRLKTGETIEVANLAESTGFVEPGSYILPLVRDEKSSQFRVAALPPSPGFMPAGQLFVYPLTPVTRKQLESIPKATSP